MTLQFNVNYLLYQSSDVKRTFFAQQIINATYTECNATATRTFYQQIANAASSFFERVV